MQSVTSRIWTRVAVSISYNDNDYTTGTSIYVEVDSQRQAENIIKTKTFHMSKCRAYLHEKLNTSKGVIRSRELALATEDEIASALGKQGVTNIKRISIRKGEQWIQTNTYILTFDKPWTSKEVKIGYYLESQAVCPSSPEVLQMSKIWIPQGSL